MKLLANIAPTQCVLSDSRRSLTAAELLDHCTRIANKLRELQIERVALLADNSADWICVDLACQQAGICLVPLPTFFSSQQARHALRTCAIQAVITDRPQTLQQITGTDIEFTPCPGCEVLAIGLTHLPTDPVQLPAGTDKITFTSGSTGQPKGVCLSTPHLLAQAQRLGDVVGLSHPKHLCLLPLSTLLENVAGVYAPLLAQGEVCVPPPGQLGFIGSVLTDPQALLTRITALQPQSLILIPQLLTMLVAATTKGWQPPASLQFVAVGGAHVAPPILLAARAAGIPVYEGYGLSECASVVSLNTRAADKAGSCGKPLPDLSITIAEGEVTVSNSSMLGYVNEPASWYPAHIATGDLGQVDADGFLSVSGRRKNLLISSYGRNISPEWVESELLAGPLLAEAVVIGDALPFCSALLSTRSPLVTDMEVQQWIDLVNCSLPDYAQVQKWLRLSAPLSANARFMTENGRPRRDNIQQAFATDIERLYDEPHLLSSASAHA